MTPLTIESLLVVDDDPLVLEVTLHVASLLAKHVESAPNGLEALKRLEARSFDAVVTDLRMPGTSGVDLASAIRASRPGVAVVVTSGYAVAEDERQISELGAVLLPKPFGLESLSVALGQARELASR